MRLAEAVQFVYENAREVKFGDKDKLSAEYWGCVDDRNEEADCLAGPGGPLGLKYAVVGGLQMYEQKHGVSGITFDRLTRAVEGALGGMTFHSDTKAMREGKSRISAGCGHCDGAIEMADQYGLEHFVHLLEAHVDELKKRGVRPKVLDGSHNAEAVFVVDKADNGQLTITLPGTSKDGRQAFICHLEDWLDVVSRLSSEVAKCADVNINAERLCKYIVAAAKRQLGVTLKRLANGLPVYRVFRDQFNAIRVELMSEDAAGVIA